MVMQARGFGGNDKGKGTKAKKGVSLEEVLMAGQREGIYAVREVGQGEWGQPAIGAWMSVLRQQPGWAQVVRVLQVRLGLVDACLPSIRPHTPTRPPSCTYSQSLAGLHCFLTSHRQPSLASTPCCLCR